MGQSASPPEATAGTRCTSNDPPWYRPLASLARRTAPCAGGPTPGTVGALRSRQSSRSSLRPLSSVPTGRRGATPRCSREALPVSSLDRDAGPAAEYVQLLVVTCGRCGFSGVVAFMVWYQGAIARDRDRRIDLGQQSTACRTISR